MVQFDNASWRRKHDGIDPNPARVPTPRRRYYPQTRQDVLDIVRDAEQMTTQVRACGSHWALSDAAVTDQFIVETQDPDGHPAPQLHGLNRTVYDVVGFPGCLSQAAIDFFDRQIVPRFDPSDPLINPFSPAPPPFYLYHVEAGTRIYELYCRLDEGDDGKHGSLAEKFQKYRGPWAMATLGGAGGQTIVGAISTGTHGGDVRLAPIADAVHAIHLIGPRQKEYWIERMLVDGNTPFPITDDNALGRQYAGIEISRDEDFFHAVLMSCGRMGIIYSIVLKVVRQYALHEVGGAKDTWTNVKQWITNPFDAHFSNRFLQAVVNPNAQPGNTSEHSCYTTVRNAEPLIRAMPSVSNPPAGRVERCGANAGNSAPLGQSNDLSTTICLHASAQDVHNALDNLISDAEIARDAALAAAIFTPPPLQNYLLALAAVLQLYIDGLEEFLQFDGTIGDFVASVLDWAAENRHDDVVRTINEFFLEFGNQPSDVHAISYAVMDTHNYLDRGCFTRGDSLEVFFGLTNPGLIPFVDAMFHRAAQVLSGSLTGRRAAFGGYASFRFTASSVALIAMQQISPTCSIEIAGLPTAGLQPFLAAVEADAVSFGARIHWGQRNNLSMIDVERMYHPFSNLLRWREALKRVSRNGRDATFSTPFTQGRGLEIVQPLIQSFAAAPIMVRAGADVNASWEAEDNPPGTQATLEVAQVGSQNAPAVLVLNGLRGNQVIRLAPGLWDIRLVVAYTLGGRSLEDQRIIRIRAV